MEDPIWHYDNIQIVFADDLLEAKLIYAKRTGLIDTPLWDSTNQTYWGWEIVDMNNI